MIRVLKIKLLISFLVPMQVSLKNLKKTELENIINYLKDKDVNFLVMDKSAGTLVNVYNPTNTDNSMPSYYSDRDFYPVGKSGDDLFKMYNPVQSQPIDFSTIDPILGETYQLSKDPEDILIISIYKKSQDESKMYSPGKAIPTKVKINGEEFV